MPDIPDDELLLEQMTIPLEKVTPPSSSTSSVPNRSTAKERIAARERSAAKERSANRQRIAAKQQKANKQRIASQDASSRAAYQEQFAGSSDLSASLKIDGLSPNQPDVSEPGSAGFQPASTPAVPDLKLFPDLDLELVPPQDNQPDYSSLLLEKDSGGIEILVAMAQKGELDPKNIDIIDATDRFLKAVAAAPRENLRQSGKIIFHASVLLRLKAEALLITRIEDLDIGGDDFIDFDTEGSPIIYDSNDEAVGRQITLADLQRALVRRSKQQKQSRQRRVTLEQLIESLREAERLDKKRAERKIREPDAGIHMDGYLDMDDMADILELAHDEDIEEVIARIEVLLVRIMNDLLRLTLKDLIKMMGGRGDWVDAFLAVLFLSNSGKINLEQDVFYGPLFLTKSDSIHALIGTGTDGISSTTSVTEDSRSANHTADDISTEYAKADNVIDITKAKSKKPIRKNAAAQTTKKPRSIIRKKTSEQNTEDSEKSSASKPISSEEQLAAESDIDDLTKTNNFEREES